MADKNNHNLDEDGWNDGSDYDMIEHLLHDVDSTKVEVSVAHTGVRNPKKRNFHSRRSPRYQRSRRVGNKSS